MALRACFLPLLVATALTLGPLPALAGYEEAQGRPVIVMLPGRGYLARDTAALRADWLDALRRGLAATGSVDLPQEDDFRVVWYAGALDPTVPSHCGSASADHAGSALPGRELASTLATAFMLAAAVVERAGSLDAEPMRAAAGDLLYFADAEKRCAAEGMLASALEEARGTGRPILLIAHSFGALVGYGHLHTRGAAGVPPIARWVTIGSLLGYPELRELLLGPRGRLAGLPAGVAAWVNVRDRNDVLAAPLLELGVDVATSPAVRDLVTEGGEPGDPHDPGRYLRDPATARAIAEAWAATPARP